jgi:hypothetical protein
MLIQIKITLTCDSNTKILHYDLKLGIAYNADEKYTKQLASNMTLTINYIHLTVAS